MQCADLNIVHRSRDIVVFQSTDFIIFHVVKLLASGFLLLLFLLGAQTMCLRQFLDTDRLVAEAKDKTHLQLLGCSHPILEERVIWTGCACWPHSKRMLLGEFYLLVLMWHRPFMNRTGDIGVDCL